LGGCLGAVWACGWGEVSQSAAEEICVTPPNIDRTGQKFQTSASPRY
jgi:hypothetical protein